MKLAAVILAGGQGKRLGGQKAIAIFHGASLVAHAIAQARRSCSDIAICVQRGTVLPPDIGYPSLPDENTKIGPLAGLQSGFAFAAMQGCDALLVLPCDMPLLPADLVKRLSEYRGDAPAVFAHCDGRDHPLCSIWSLACGPVLETYLAGSRRSVRGFAEAVGAATAHWPASERLAFLNINNPQDMVEARRAIADNIGS